MDNYIDILGQDPGLYNLYTQISFCFPVADASSHSTVIETLTKGLERLSTSYPWIAGNVVGDRIQSLEKTPRLVVKDHRYDPLVPTMDALRQASFPFSMLDESIIAPRNTIPGGSESDSPVFLIQVNFITGGLLLTFNGQHQAMDMVGQGQIIRLLSKACRNEPFTSEELSSGNLARRNLIPLLDDSYEPGPEVAHQVVNPLYSSPPRSVPCTWAYFSFPSSSLSDLKSLATQTLISGYISTDDALSALIWRSVTRARLPRLNFEEGESTFNRAIDARRYLDIPSTYTGAVHNNVYVTCAIRELLDQPLGRVASRLRAAVDPKTSNAGYATRAIATVLSRATDKSIVSPAATLDLSVDMMLSSWAKVDCCHHDFNLGLGKPEAVRRPLFAPVESLMILMPRALDGEIAVALCLSDEDLGNLKADEEFTKYGRYIG